MTATAAEARRAALSVQHGPGGMTGPERRESPPGARVAVLPWAAQAIRPARLRIPVADSFLSARECQVLRFVARGFTCEEIAAELGLSSNTVRTHIRRMIARTGAANRPALVMAGIRAQVLPIAPPPRAPLDPAERRLVALIADGLRTREIAAVLHVSEATVAYRVKVLVRLLRARDRAHLVWLASGSGAAP